MLFAAYRREVMPRLVGGRLVAPDKNEFDDAYSWSVCSKRDPYDAQVRHREESVADEQPADRENQAGHHRNNGVAAWQNTRLNEVRAGSLVARHVRQFGLIFDSVRLAVAARQGVVPTR